MRSYYIRKLNKLFDDQNKEHDKAMKNMRSKSHAKAPKTKRR